MKPVTDNQRREIERLSRLSKTNVDLAGLSSLEASRIITRLRGQVGEPDGRGRSDSASGSEALAGLAMKLIAQRGTPEWIFENEMEFRSYVVKLYHVFVRTRQACLSPEDVPAVAGRPRLDSRSAQGVSGPPASSVPGGV